MGLGFCFRFAGLFWRSLRVSAPPKAGRQRPGEAPRRRARCSPTKVRAARLRRWPSTERLFAGGAIAKSPKNDGFRESLLGFQSKSGCVLDGTEQDA
jgi:hypothetical protein